MDVEEMLAEGYYCMRQIGIHHSIKRIDIFKDTGSSYSMVVDGDYFFLGFRMDLAHLRSYDADLYVDKMHRNNGLGSQLVDFYEMFSRNVGMEYIVLSINEAPDFWNKMGYVNGTKRL